MPAPQTVSSDGLIVWGHRLRICTRFSNGNLFTLGMM
jgi:hypothetical protein